MSEPEVKLPPTPDLREGLSWIELEGRVIAFARTAVLEDRKNRVAHLGPSLSQTVQFEAWAKSRGHDPTVYGDGNYADEVIPMWEAWQRSAAIERERCAKLCEEGAASVTKANTSRGRINSAAGFAVGVVEDLAAMIRKGEAQPMKSQSRSHWRA